MEELKKKLKSIISVSMLFYGYSRLDIAKMLFELAVEFKETD